MSKKECVAAAEAIFQARVIVERYLQLPEGKLDTKLYELEMDYWRHADAPPARRPKLTPATPRESKKRKAKAR